MIRADVPQVGVTGTRGGLTSPQRVALWKAMRHLYLNCGSKVLQHGDCVGVDEEAAVFGAAMGYWVVARPPVVDKYRAFHPSDVVMDPQVYHVRNRAIVDSVDLLIGCPAVKGSGGTWSTIRYARTRRDVGLLVIGPGGEYLEQHLWREIAE